MRKVSCIMLYAVIVFILCVFTIAGGLLAVSPGRPRPFKDGKGKLLTGSISEKLHIKINGAEQGMFLKGRDHTKPVLLFLHGGPGMPNAWINRKYRNVLEDDFLVCYWEQRGAGLSYRSDTPPETVTTEQLISDAIAVTNYLRQRFAQEKIYLLGHSYGSFIGIQASARAPELYKAYIGVAQISRQFESEKRAYEYMMEYFTKAGNQRMLRRLEKFPVARMDSFPNAYRALRDQAMHSAGIGTTHNMKSVLSGIFMPVNLNREYTLREKMQIWRGKWSACSTNLWNTMVETDVTQKIEKLAVPVYLIHGRHDYTVAYPLTKAYFEKLQAPMKGFYTFEQSAHSPFIEEPEKMQNILQEDVLAGRNNLADTR